LIGRDLIGEKGGEFFSAVVLLLVQEEKKRSRNKPSRNDGTHRGHQQKKNYSKSTSKRSKEHNEEGEEGKIEMLSASWKTFLGAQRHWH
jgi:hypothetical protein